MNKGIKILMLCLLSTLCFVTNVNAEELVYGEDIPVGSEGEYQYAEDETITDAYTDLTSEEANELKVSLESSGYTTVIIKSYMKKTGEIKDTVEKHFNTYDEALEYIESLKNSGLQVENINFVYDTESVSLNETYSTLEEAQAALQEFIDTYENASGNLTPNDPSNNDTVIGTTEGTTAYETYEEANTALESFLSQNETDEFYFVGEVVGPKGTGEYTTSVISESFNSEQEALDYLSNLEAQGYEIIDSLFTNDTDEAERFLNERCETEAEAKAAIEAFKNQYHNVSTNVEKVHDESEDTTEPFNQNFNSESEANDYLNSQLGLNNEDTVVTGEVTSSSTAGETSNIEEVYETENAAQARLTEITNQYDVVESSNIEEVQAGTVYEAQLVTQNQNEYVVTDSLFVINRHGHNIYVWTLNQLTAEEIAEFKRTYKEMNNPTPIDSSMPNVDNGTFIHGLDSEFLSGNNKLFTIEQKEDGTWVAIMDSGSTSHVIYGAFIPINEYHLTANVHNNIYTWTAAGNILTKGYDYVVTGSGYETVTLESGVLTGNKKIENQGYYYNVTQKAKSYTVNATGTKTLESGTLTADTTEEEMTEFYSLDLIRQKYEFIGGMGEGEDPEEPTDNPKTADNSIYALIIGFISLIGLVITSSLKKAIE